MLELLSFLEVGFSGMYKHNSDQACNFIHCLLRFSPSKEVFKDKSLDEG